MAEKIKVVVTDYIEDTLDWEAEQLKEKEPRIDFECCQLKFKPEQEVLEKVAEEQDPVKRKTLL